MEKNVGFVEILIGVDYKIGGKIYKCTRNDMGSITMVSHDHDVQPNVISIIPQVRIPSMLGPRYTDAPISTK